ncbi:hypothetical protein T4E_5975 [Trichinella pseudospiralis]|uniref:Uncharacterized protein n=1 Tax=Trichinella pseudospiralis TaxID=6337 RepID=A0A0V1FYJ9_TRIPS|nr:hypothetical protein T4E_5975 [Trichinella pseudospiralis]KRY91178.1 hypothetical protein T4D_2369 [Trichinella pseudospiralis]
MLRKLKSEKALSFHSNEFGIYHQNDDENTMKFCHLNGILAGNTREINDFAMKTVANYSQTMEALNSCYDLLS